MNKRIGTAISVVWIVLGLLLFVLGIAEVVDSYWSGMGTGLLFVGLLQLLKRHRLLKNPKYREKMEVEVSDERNHFIRNKAWAWSGYVFVLVSAVSSIVLKIVGQELLSQAAGFAVCLMLILYWIFWLVLKKKY